jgi:hypothetical protein
MADAEKCRRGITPRGTTVTTALQWRQRYLRTATTRWEGCSPGPRGPRTWRARQPCPTRPISPPSGAPAFEQAGQHAGRAQATVGGCSAQNLTSMSEWTTCRALA